MLQYPQTEHLVPWAEVTGRAASQHPTRHAAAPRGLRPLSEIIPRVLAEVAEAMRRRAAGFDGGDA